MNIAWGIVVAFATYLVLLVVAGGRPLDQISIVVFLLLSIVVGTLAGRRRSKRARLESDRTAP